MSRIFLVKGILSDSRRERNFVPSTIHEMAKPAE